MQITFYSPSSGTPSSLLHSVTIISLRYLRPLRSIIAPSILSFIRRASGFPQHKYLRHFISLRLYLFHFAGSISALHTSITSANATFAQSKPFVRYISFLLYPCFSALHFCLPTMLCFIYCGYAWFICRVLASLHFAAFTLSQVKRHTVSAIDHPGTATDFTHSLLLHRVYSAPYPPNTHSTAAGYLLPSLFSGSVAVTE